MESIMHRFERKEYRRCWFCKSQKNLELHHCIHGTANRKLADEDGLTVWLCHECHQNLHDHGDGDEELKHEAMLAWMFEYNKTKKDFLKRYGKMY